MSGEIKLYKKEWDSIMLLEFDGWTYQLNDRDDLFYTLLDVLSPKTSGEIHTLTSEEFWCKVND